MKQLKILPLVAIISGVMVGCGGGSGGGGSASRTTFTFDFAIPVPMTEAAATTKGCTIFDRVASADGTTTALTYSQASQNQVANYVIGYYSNVDGERVDEIITPTNGSFSFVLEDIPEGGYVTFQELEFNGREIRVNSFSREFLEDKQLRSATFGLNRDPVNNCFTGNNLSEKSFTNLSYRNAVSGGGDYHYVSQKDIFVSPNYDMSSNEELIGISGEPTVLFQYVSNSNNSSLHQYGIGSWGTSNINLVETDVTSSIYSSSNYEYASLKIGFVANSFLYDAIDLDNSVGEYNRPSEAQKETWVFMASVEDAENGWDSLLTGIIDSSWDIDVNPSSYLNIENLPTDKPSVWSQGSQESVIDLNMGFTDLTEGYVRTAYSVSSTDASNSYQVIHRIFTKSNDDYVVTPELYYYNFPSSVVSGLKVSENADFSRTAILIDENSNINSKTFLSLFANGSALEPELDADLDGILASEKEGRENEVSLRTSNSLVISRFN